MWFLNFLPDWIFHLILLAGIGTILVSWLLKAVPFVNTYTLQLQVLGIILTVVGVWYEGGIAKDAEYRAALAAFKENLARSEKRSMQINTVIEKQIIKEKETIKLKGDTVREYIAVEVEKYDQNCPLPPSAIKAHNASARNEAILKEPPQGAAK